MKKRLGEVYWANSRKIDSSDKKTRRRYTIVKDNGINVSVSKIRGYNNNKKNIDRLFELDCNKYPLNKKSGIDNKVYSRRADNHKPLRLEDNEVFDLFPDFRLTSHDTHKSLLHTRNKRKQKKRKY